MEESCSPGIFCDVVGRGGHGRPVRVGGWGGVLCCSLAEIWPSGASLSPVAALSIGCCPKHMSYVNMHQVSPRHHCMWYRLRKCGSLFLDHLTAALSATWRNYYHLMHVFPAAYDERQLSGCRVRLMHVRLANGEYEAGRKCTVQPSTSCRHSARDPGRDVSQQGALDEKRRRNRSRTRRE